MRWAIRPSYGTGPLPRPATQRKCADWAVGRGSGLVPRSALAEPNHAAFYARNPKRMGTLRIFL